MKFKFTLLFCFLSFYSFSQSTKLVFGKISDDEYNFMIVPFEESASAVILSEYGELQLQNYGYIIKEHIRKKILKQNAVEGNVLKYTYNPKDNYNRVKINNVQVYNKVGNEVIITKFNTKELIEELVDENTINIIYAIPNVKVGSIIEYETVISRSSDLYATPWKFQNDYPVLKSKLDLKMYTDFDYRFFLIGQKLNEKYANRKGNKSWEIENVPSLEKYDKIYNVNDYKEIIGYQYTAEQDWHGTIFSSPTWLSFRNVWNKKIEDKTRNVNFKEIAQHIKNGTSQKETYKNVVEYIQQNYKVEKNNIIDDITYFNSGIIKTKTGNNLEFVVLLNKLLKEKGINNSYLVINSFRQKGRLIMNYPILSRISNIQNLTIIDNQIYMFDNNILKIENNSFKEKIFYPYLDYYNQLVLRLDSKSNEFININPPLSESYLINEIEFKENVVRLKSLNKFKGYFKKENQKSYNFPLFTEQTYTSEEINNEGEFSIINKIFEQNNKQLDNFSFEFPFNQDINDLNIQNDRNYQVELDFPFQKMVQYKFIIPKNYFIEYDKFDKSISDLDNNLQYKQQIEIKNNECVITYFLLVNNSIILKSKLKEYSNFLSKIAGMNKDVILLKKK